MSDQEQGREQGRPRMTHFDAPERASRPQAPGATPDFTEISNGATRKVQQRGLRRALAVNAVLMAREHAERSSEPVSQADADVIMYITELLDKVAGTP
jgi:hypothetical protein